MSWKRKKPYFPRHHHASPSSSLSKRQRPTPSSSELEFNNEDQAVNRQLNSVVVVTGLGSACSVLDLKSRFEMYGPISRLRIDRGGIGYITFRSRDSADAAIAASLDPSFGIIIHDSNLVQVSWANDPVPQWREGVGHSSNKDRPSSKLLRAELPLSRHGRENKLGTSRGSPRNGLDLPFKGREIIAYDDLL